MSRLRYSLCRNKRSTQLLQFQQLWQPSRAGPSSFRMVSQISLALQIGASHDGVMINVQSLQTDLSDGTGPGPILYYVQSRIADIRYHRPCSPSRSPKHRREVQAFAAFRVELVRLSRQLKRVHSKSAVRTAGQSAEIATKKADMCLFPTR
jgi:hypothetical protein